MSVRRRKWKDPQGETREAWVVDYVDQHGKRHLKTFPRKRDADAYHATVTVDVRKGIHTADSDSVDITRAGQLWLTTGTANGLERTTLDGYRQRLDLHITPLLGSTKLSQLTVPMVRHFEDKLRRSRSPAMVRMVLGALGAILADAQERGLVSQNVVRGLRSRRLRGKERRADRRQRGKLRIGVDIPSPEQIRAILLRTWMPKIALQHSISDRILSALRRVLRSAPFPRTIAITDHHAGVAWFSFNMGNRIEQLFFAAVRMVIFSSDFDLPKVSYCLMRKIFSRAITLGLTN